MQSLKKHCLRFFSAIPQRIYLEIFLGTTFDCNRILDSIILVIHSITPEIRPRITSGIPTRILADTFPYYSSRKISTSYQLMLENSKFESSKTKKNAHFSDHEPVCITARLTNPALKPYSVTRRPGMKYENHQPSGQL